MREVQKGGLAIKCQLSIYHFSTDEGGASGWKLVAKLEKDLPFLPIAGMKFRFGEQSVHVWHNPFYDMDSQMVFVKLGCMEYDAKDKLLAFLEKNPS